MKKDKIVAALLAFFLGVFGAHKFYLGRQGQGIVYALFFWTGIPALVSFIESIVLFTMPDYVFDYRYNYNLPHLPHGEPRYAGNSLQGAPPRPRMNIVRPVEYNYKLLLKRVTRLRNEIVKQLKQLKSSNSGLLREIKPIVDNYIKQVKLLVERDRKLKTVLRTTPPAHIERSIQALQQKAQMATLPALKQEYMHSIEKHRRHKKTLEEFIEQREMMRTRLDSTIMSLEQIHFDLMRVETVTSEEQKEEVLRSLEEKSNELSIYLDALKDTYRNDDFNIDQYLDNKKID